MRASEAVDGRRDRSLIGSWNRPAGRRLAGSGFPAAGGAALATTLFSFIAFLVVLPPVPYWLDAPEFIAAGANLGLPHPPGHPAMVLLLKGFLLIPVGDAAFRANLFSATFGAVSAGLVSLLASGAAAALGSRRAPWVAAAGLAAGMGFALSGSAMMQSLSVEAYTFSCSLVLGALVLAMRHPADARAGCVAAILLALGLANHHLLVLLALPAVAIAWLRREVRWPAIAAVGVTGIAVTVACYLYLPLRGAAGAEPAWSDTTGFDGVFWYASARIFAGSVGGFAEAGSSLGENGMKALGLLAGALSPPTLVAAMAGTYLLVRSGGWRWALVLLVLLAGNLPSKVGMGILDPSNPDDHGYFLPSIAALSVLASAAGAGLPALAASLSPGARRLASWFGAILLVAVGVLPTVLSGAAMADERAAMREPVDVARAIWESVPPRAVLMPSHYPVHFLLMSGQVVEGTRPDVTLVQQSLYAKARGGRHYASRLAARDPDLGPFARSFLRTGELDWDLLRLLADRRPLLLQASNDLEVPLGDLRFDGWLFSVNPPGAQAVSVTPGVAAHLADLRDVARHWPRMDVETRRVLLRHLATSGTWLAGQGHRAEAARLLDAALDLNPRDAMLKHMRAALGSP